MQTRKREKRETEITVKGIRLRKSKKDWAGLCECETTLSELNSVINPLAIKIVSKSSKNIVL